MATIAFSAAVFLLLALSSGHGQRITTIQLDGVQYFISRMNPYSPELNYYLAYQYCRSLGLQLASFETREKADSITQYLTNAGYNKFDFWTSGNKLGTDMLLWMSTGLPFNATFNYMKKNTDEGAMIPDIPSGSTSPQRTARESGDSGSSNGCVALKAPTFEWDTDNCMSIKDFICEQTRCYYYNYGSIPVSSAQGRPSTPKPYTSSLATESSKYQQPLGINELINKLKSTTEFSMRNDDVYGKRGASEPEKATNGPYDNLRSSIELQDDPAAIADHHMADIYPSTIEPDVPTNPSFN